MVKHQRRSHQRGSHSLDNEEYTSEDDDRESPSSPRQTGLSWPNPHHLGGHPGLQAHTIHRAASFADFGQHVNDYSAQQQQYNHRHSVSAGGTHEYHGEVQQPQHAGVHMLHRTPSMPSHPYYVTEQNNPGIATMNTAPIQGYQMPRQQPDRLALEIPYMTTNTAGSIQGSPNSYTASVPDRNPSAQEGYYTHQPPPAPYSLNASSPLVEQPMVQYAQQTPQPVPQVTTAQQVQHVQEQYQPPPPHQPEHTWYDGVPYQPPVEVPTVGQLPSFGSGIYDQWTIKPDFEDPSMLMPSQRVGNM